MYIYYSMNKKSTLLFIENDLKGADRGSVMTTASIHAKHSIQNTLTWLREE